MKNFHLLLLLALPLAIAGCGGGSDVGVAPPAATSGKVTIVTLATIRPAGDPGASATKVDGPGTLPLTPIVPAGTNAMQIRFLDRAGKDLVPPVEVAAEGVVTIDDVPLAAASTKVDYLRNGGYALNTGAADIAWSGTDGRAESVPKSAAASASRWRTEVDDGGTAHVRLAVTTADGGAAPAADFLPRGVAYSPAPIGFSNKDGPGFGDIFWDTPGPFLDFERVWKRDLQTLRDSGFNTVRTYSLIAHFINNDGSIPTPQDFQQPGTLLVRQHQKFLDELWNNGQDPIYVIVGIPMPPAIYIKQVHDNTSANELAYWDDNFTATVQQMKNHPAVLGFTIFNEVGGQPDYAGDPAKAGFYWSQVQKYSTRAKQLAPDKLVGWAFNDDPVFARDTVEYRQTYAQSVDFYGVNAFQRDQLKTTLDPWAASAQRTSKGSAARPVLLTEYGLPATGHRDGSPLSIYADPTTIKNAAGYVSARIAEAFGVPIMAGMTYFEWSDEWWKQPGGLNTRWDGGDPNAGFPNGYWDEEGFGLNSIALNGRNADQVYTDNLGGKGGNLQVDKLTPRSDLLNAVVDAFRQAPHKRAQALGK